MRLGEFESRRVEEIPGEEGRIGDVLVTSKSIVVASLT